MTILWTLDSKRQERVVSITTGAAIVTAAMIAGGSDQALAYTPGMIRTKADPILQMLRELADPVLVGMLTWACIRYIMNQRGEAKEMIGSSLFGYALLKMSPVIIDVFNS